MKRNKKLDKIAEKDLARYKDDGFLSTLKETVRESSKSIKRQKSIRSAVWAVSTVAVVVVVAVISLIFAYSLNTLLSKNKATDSNLIFQEINSFVQNVQFKNLDDAKINVYKNNDKDKPFYNVQNSEINIDIYKGDATIISENIYTEVVNGEGFDMNCFEQTFSENNEEHISISGIIDTGKEVLYFMYVKPLGTQNKDEFMKQENKKLVGILNSLIVTK